MIEHITSKSGLKITKINDYLCHSLYNPEKEAISFVDKNIEDVQIHFIYGYGDGYIINEFLKREELDNTFYVIIDPFIDISKLKHEKAEFILFKDEKTLREKLTPYMWISFNRKITVSPNYDKMDLEKYKNFLLILKDMTKIAKVNENTVSKYANMWYENYLKNLNYLNKDHSVATLKNISNKPVVVASGGPSLTKQLPILKNYRDNIIIISAGSTTNSLLSEGIIPDIVVSIDGHEINYNHFKGKQFSEDTLFIYSMQSYPEIRTSFKNGYYFLDLASTELKDHLNKFGNEEVIILAGGGSVAHFALSIAKYISTGEIALIGQDLAYTNGLTHAKNNVYRKEVKDTQNLVEIIGYNNEKVYTDYMFLSMKKTFEEMASTLNMEKVFNCTEGGVKLDGYKEKTFKQFCEDNYLYNHSIKSETLIHMTSEKSNKRIYSELKKELALYKNIARVTKLNMNLLKANRKKASFSPDVLNKMSINDKIMKNGIKGTPISIAFRAIDIKVNKKFKASLNESPQEQYDRIYRQNEYLYTATNEVVKKGIEILGEIINEGAKNGI